MNQPDPRIGQVLGGRYELLRKMGAGGQSVVYAALDRVDGDEVAVKVLHARAVKREAREPMGPDAQERMFREAQAMASLAGTAAVRVLHQLWADDGAMCLVMELLHGDSLSTYLDAREKRGERMPPRVLFDLLAPIVHTLEEAHTRGIVHRDLKPENVFIVDPAKGGGVRLLDFGFAKFVRAPPITDTGMVAGSPCYIAPEAWLQGSSGLDHRIDIYALGVILFRALGGQVPFDAADMRDLYKLVTTAHRPSLHALRPDLPASVDEWTRQALAVRPDDRFNRVLAMWNALRAAMEG